ncbi:UNVERIFIED_CONTAM: hypothetical protein Sangu_2340700 [Sesamum angustifolium]|uniref:Uncharacterized protein n=1 Tax=Sesamum angustifolium TaxID=2727405 RepID=A0AAW2L9Z8_9LAMI
MIPKRFEDSPTGGASREMTILEISVLGCADPSITVADDLERGTKGALETTYRAWVAPLDVSPTFCLFTMLVGVFMIYSRLQLCVPTDGAN